MYVRSRMSEKRLFSHGRTRRQQAGTLTIALDVCWWYEADEVQRMCNLHELGEAIASSSMPGKAKSGEKGQQSTSRGCFVIIFDLRSTVCNEVATPSCGREKNAGVKQSV